jgi:thiosulfate dehydrogenase
MMKQKRIRGSGKWLLLALLLLIIMAAGCSANDEEAGGLPYEPPTMDDLDPNEPQTASILYGEEIFNKTDTVLADEVGNRLSCSSCHSDGGLANAISMVGTTAKYPSFRQREEAIFTIEDRINGCMLRSMNGVELDEESKEMIAVADYLNHLGDGYEEEDVTWGLEAMEEVPEPDVTRGEELFIDKSCFSCHATDGSGKGPTSGPPLWGDGSFNDGAGLGRLAKISGFIKHNMPPFDPGSLTDQEAADLGAFILSHERPVWPGHKTDWPNGGRPSDIIDQDRREQIRAGTFDWTELDNVVKKEPKKWEKE